MIAKRKIVYGYTSTEPAPADPYLMAAFNFNEYDLHFNQQGDLSDRQFKDLRERRTYIILFITLVAIFPFILGMTTNLGSIYVPLIGFYIVITIIWLKLVWTYWSRYSNDMYDAPIARVTGDVQLNFESPRRSGTYALTMTINEQHFQLNKPQFLAMKNRDMYTVYYTPNSKHLLSIAHEDV